MKMSSFDNLDNNRTKKDLLKEKTGEESNLNKNKGSRLIISPFMFPNHGLYCRKSQIIKYSLLELVKLRLLSHEKSCHISLVSAMESWRCGERGDSGGRMRRDRGKDRSAARVTNPCKVWKTGDSLHFG